MIRGLFEARCGIMIRESKRTVLETRVAARLTQLGLSGLQAYVRYLGHGENGRREFTWLTNQLTTNKTSFFRESHHFDYLHETLLLPRLEEARRTKRPPRIRLWSAACSTGQEPYSLAIRALESWRSEPAASVRILATDLDTDVLAHAEAAVYNRPPESELDDRLVKKYFLKGVGEQAGKVRVRPEVRERIRFAQLNLKSEPWPDLGIFDAVFCRNVLIYFSPEEQRRVALRLREHLKDGGLLMIGHSENLLRLQDRLQPLRNTIYRRRSAVPE